MSATNFGMKVSLPGVEVQDATPEQCVLHSSYPCPKVDTRPGSEDPTNPKHFGLVNINFQNDPSDGFTRLFTITHGYDYIPSCLGTAQFTIPTGILAGVYGGTMPLLVTGATLNFFCVTDISSMYVIIGYDSAFGTLVGNTLAVSYQLFAEDGA